MFRRHFERNQREKQCRSRQSAEDEEVETSSVSGKSSKSTKSRKSTGHGIVNRLNERLRHQAYSGSDFNDYSADNEYDEIADSDRELSDEEYQRHSSMEI